MNDIPSPDRLEDEEIREKAEAVRTEFNLTPDEIPVPVEEIIEVDLEIEPVLLPDLKSKYDIDGFLTKDFKQIYIDKNTYENPRMIRRLRFTFAHELGHIYLHKHYVNEIEFKSEKEWIEFRSGISKISLSSYEYQANEFAGRFLVPKEKLIEELEKNRQDIDAFIKVAPHYNVDQLISYVSNNVCGDFNVSDGVISRRIKKERIWNEMNFGK